MYIYLLYFVLLVLLCFIDNFIMIFVIYTGFILHLFSLYFVAFYSSLSFFLLFFISYNVVFLGLFDHLLIVCCYLYIYFCVLLSILVNVFISV